MSGPGDGFVEGMGDPPTGSFDTAAIAAAVKEQSGPPRMGASRFAGHGAADTFSTRGPASTGWISPMLSGPIRDGGYLRAMLGNLYFGLPAIGAALGLVAGISTDGLAVPPALVLTLVIIALGAFDAFSGLAALGAFAVVTLLTGNLLGSHMVTAPPGQQNAVYSLTGLFGLGVLWFAGAYAAQRIRPLQIHREGTPLVVWTRRATDYAVIPILGTFVIWLAAWQMPTLTGNGPQELFVTIQDHLLEVKVVAFLAILARVLLEATADHHFHVRTAAVVPEVGRPRRGPMAWLFWLVRAAFALMILWEFLGFGWMTWVNLALFVAIGIAAWAGRQFDRRTIGKTWFPIALLRIIVVVVLAQLLMSQLTRHMVNPTPMLGALLIGIGILLVLFAFTEQVVGTGARQDWKSTVVDGIAIVLVVLLVYGTIGFTATPFIEPRGVYVAPTGAVFVADTNNNRVVLVWKNGYRQTIPADGGWLRPADVTADGDPYGFAYVADSGHNRIVRLSGYYNYTVGSHTFNLALASGVVSETSIGIGLNDPQSVSVDGLGNLYVADTGNNRIVKINRVTGRQTTFLRGLSGPLAVLADPFYTQTVYVANTGAGTVLQILPNGKHVVFLSGLHEPSGLAEDPYGNFFVSEMGSGQILEVSAYGTKSIIETGLGHPRGLSVDALGNLFVSDADGGQIKVIASLREHILLTHGIPDPSAVAYAPDGTVYVTDAAQRLLQSWSSATLRTVATLPGVPIGVAAEGSAGGVWVDFTDGRLGLVDPRTGAWRTVLSGLDRPRQLWSLPNGTVLVALEGAGEILAVTPQGATTVVRAGLYHPVGIAEDPYGDYVVGLGGPVRHVTMRKGQPRTPNSGDVYEFAPAGKLVWLFNLREITSIAMDSQGNAYVASWMYRLVVMHVAASGRDAVVNRDFRSLSGMSCSPDGRLWIADRKSIGMFEVRPTHIITQM